MTDLKSEGLLEFTWALYHQKIFHNTQLNDLLKKSTKDPAKWDFRKGTRIRSIKPMSPEQIERSFSNYERKYGAHLSDLIELTIMDKRYLARFSADSIRIRTIDEKAFGSFSYTLKVYSPKPGKIRIRYQTRKSEDKKRSQQALAVTALESAGGKLLAIKQGFQEDEIRWIEFNIPGEGHFNLQLAQFQATPVEWVIMPEGNLLYIEKKQVIHHAIQLIEEKESRYNNTQLAVWNNKQPFSFQPIFNNVKNTISFLSAEGKPLDLVYNAGRNNYLVAAQQTAEPFSFYMNEIFRWPAVLKDIPPFFFFLKTKN
ncbi:MAG: hypothetical protein EOP48_06695 [Sphingobacteriales bacterium]|nr:MAG: hypothetical protein EOP48_06695 [Sphingobacteriales bacterium]